MLEILHGEAEDFPELGWQCNVLKVDADLEEGCHLIDVVSGDAAAHAGDEEAELGMLLSKLGETVYRFGHVFNGAG